MKGNAILILACFLIALNPSIRAQDKGSVSQTPAFGDGEYRLGPGDVIEVFVWREPDLTTTAPVRPDGKISLPLLNEFEAQNKTVAQLQMEVANNLRKYLAEPVVTVILKEVNAPRISVMGNVRKPDVYKIHTKLNVFDAIALAGGFNDYAKRNKVIVIRTTTSGTERFRLNVKKLLEDPSLGIFYLSQNDTIYVE
jgi:polysaccharide export outer membrane protein